MNPGTRIALKVVRELNRAWKAPRQRRAQRLFKSIRFEPGDIAIDCGANVGEISRELAERGALVHAFEPNPVAMAILRQRLGSSDKVICIEKAVSDHDGSSRLYLHRHHDDDPLEHSPGSSLVASKHNLDERHFLTVETVDLASYIEGLPRRVKLLKIDVEGLEVLLIEHLLERQVLDRIDLIMCETHEYKIPGLAAQLRQLRQRLARAGINHVNLDWV